MVSPSRGHAFTSIGAEPVAMTTFAALDRVGAAVFFLDDDFGRDS